MATSGQIEKVLTVLNAMYPKEVAFLTMEQMGARQVMYTRLLADIDADMLGLAVDQYIANDNKDYPTPGKLRDMAMSIARAADDAPDAATAWRQACSAVEPWMDGWQYKAGARERLHPRVAKAIDSYDGRRIAAREEQHAGTDFAQWRGLYESLAHRADEQARWLPQVRARVEAMRAELEAARPAQIEAPEGDAEPESPRRRDSALEELRERGYERINSPRAPVRLGDLLNTSAPQLTKEQLDRRAHAARLVARRDALREALRAEVDETKRRALEVQIDGITRTVAQYEVNA
jgi:hypothetical protein